jgi:hypothetical protein
MPRTPAPLTVEQLENELAIVKLAIPLEDELSEQIDEMCKHLLTEQGFTLNGIGRLLIQCQRRMASDWSEIGRLRRQSEADARAFVALPALIKAARVILTFIEQDAMPNVAIEDDLRAALAQADGPAPKE